MTITGMFAELQDSSPGLFHALTGVRLTKQSGDLHPETGTQTT